MDARRLSKNRSLAPRLRHVDRDAGDAFVPDFRHGDLRELVSCESHDRGFVPVKDCDAEAFGEEFIAAATSAEAMGETARDELIDEDLDGLTIEMSFEEAAEGPFYAVDRT